MIVFHFAFKNVKKKKTEKDCRPSFPSAEGVQLNHFGLIMSCFVQPTVQQTEHIQFIMIMKQSEANPIWHTETHLTLMNNNSLFQSQIKLPNSTFISLYYT